MIFCGFPKMSRNFCDFVNKLKFSTIYLNKHCSPSAFNKFTPTLCYLLIMLPMISALFFLLVSVFIFRIRTGQQIPHVHKINNEIVVEN